MGSGSGCSSIDGGGVTGTDRSGAGSRSGSGNGGSGDNRPGEGAAGTRGSDSPALNWPLAAPGAPTSGALRPDGAGSAAEAREGLLTTVPDGSRSANEGPVKG
ncbi:hypothetical protein ACTI_79510 [Actinoplanes sp. OR16]|nr:hypothetical protein ACTI_79510 [Actinoplanes sp. OR16]